MKRVNVILMGVGTAGQQVTKCLVTKRGIEIVGALDLDKAKVGKDLGDLSGVGKKLGVIVTDDADALFSQTYADVVIHTVSATVHEAYPQLVKPIENGMNVISAGEAISNPYVSDPALAAKLDKLARKHGVAVLGTGHWPIFMDLYLPLALTGLCREVRKIKYVRHSDVRPYRESIIWKKFGLGLSRQEFKKGVEEGVVIGHAGFEESFKALADRFGWKLEQVKRNLEPIYDKEGKFLAVRTGAQGIVDGEVRIEMEIVASIDIDLKETYDAITIDATPLINMVISPCLMGTIPVSNVLVNSIPVVMNAEPGLITGVDRPLFALEGDVGRFLK